MKITQLLQQIKKVSFLMFMIWFIYLIIMGLIIGIGKLKYNIPVGYFTREPNTTLDKPFYIGAFSNLGIILWTAAASLCIFSSFYLKRYYRNSPFRLFLLHAGILTTVLLLDDCYMFHENMFPYYFGINEKIIYGIYFSYTVYFLIRFRKTIFKTDYIILLTSLSLLSLSVLVDVLDESRRFTALTGLSFANHEEIRILFEDAIFKGLGILTWLVYFSRVAFVNALPQINTANVENSGKESIAVSKQLQK